VQTGKGQFKDFANSVIDDLQRLAIRALLNQALSGLNFGGSPQLGGSPVPRRPIAFQHGGNFPAYRNLLVGEEGPEIVRFGQTGTVVPANQTADILGGRPRGSSSRLSGGGSTTNQFTFNITGVSDADSFRRSRRQIEAEAQSLATGRI
jgi:hypothetical protein